MDERYVFMMNALKDFENEQEKFMDQLENYFGDVPNEILTNGHEILNKVIKMIAWKEGIDQEELAEQLFEK